MSNNEIDEIIQIVSYLDQYLFVTNMIAWGLMWLDKTLARKHMWRIPEKILFLSAIIGGSLGAWLGMYAYRHKTKHITFVVGIPAIFVIQCVLIYFYIAQ